MAGSMRITLDAAALGALDKEVQSRLRNDVAPEIEATAKRLVPVRTGNLRDSIKTVEQDGHFLIGSEEEYASEVELGTSDTRAQSYLRAASKQANL